MTVLRFIIVLGLGLGFGSLWTGCTHSRLVQQVSSKSDSTSSMDSSSSTRKDSSFYSRDVKPKTLEGSTVAKTFTQGQWDSVLVALRSLPKGVNHTIYMSDPTMQSTLAIALDSLGQIRLRCTTAARVYFETIEKQGRVIESHSAELHRKELLIKELEQKVFEQQQSFFGRLGNNLSTIVTILIVLAVALGIYTIVKRFA